MKYCERALQLIECFVSKFKLLMWCSMTRMSCGCRMLRVKGTSEFMWCSILRKSGSWSSSSDGVHNKICLGCNIFDSGRVRMLSKQSSHKGHTSTGCVLLSIFVHAFILETWTLYRRLYKPWENFTCAIYKNSWLSFSWNDWLPHGETFSRCKEIDMKPMLHKRKLLYIGQAMQFVWRTTALARNGTHTLDGSE